VLGGGVRTSFRGRVVPIGTVLNLRTTALRNVQRFRGGLAIKARTLLYHSTPGLRVIKKKKKKERVHGSGTRIKS